MAEENKLQEMIRTSLESIRAMVDANTVVGTPIETPSGTTIIPISKVSVGYASGGLDFANKNAAKNFGGGGGTGLCVQPVCFLAVNAADELTVAAKGTPLTPEWAADITSAGRETILPSICARWLQAVIRRRTFPRCSWMSATASTDTSPVTIPPRAS